MKKYQKKLAQMPKQKGPEYILEPNPDGPSISKDEIRKLERNDSLEFHQEKRVWWVKQKQDNVVSSNNKIHSFLKKYLLCLTSLYGFLIFAGISKN